MTLPLFAVLFAGKMVTNEKDVDKSTKIWYNILVMKYNFGRSRM